MPYSGPEWPAESAHGSLAAVGSGGPNCLRPGAGARDRQACSRARSGAQTLYLGSHGNAKALPWAESCDPPGHAETAWRYNDWNGTKHYREISLMLPDFSMTVPRGAFRKEAVFCATCSMLLSEPRYHENCAVFTSAESSDS